MEIEQYCQTVEAKAAKGEWGAVNWLTSRWYPLPADLKANARASAIANHGKSYLSLKASEVRA